MNDPNPQIEQILAALATTKEEMKALETRLARLERPLPGLPGLPELPGLSDEDRKRFERLCAEEWAEVMERVARHRRRMLEPGYAERRAELKRRVRELGFED